MRYSFTIWWRSVLGARLVLLLAATALAVLVPAGVSAASVPVVLLWYGATLVRHHGRWLSWLAAEDARLVEQLAT